MPAPSDAASDVPAATRDYLADETLHHIPSADEAVRVEGVRAILGAPLHVEGRVIGALLVADRYPRTYDHAEVTTINSLASLAAVAIGTAQLVESLNRSLDQARRAEAESQRHVTDLERLARAEGGGTHRGGACGNSRHRRADRHRRRSARHENGRRSRHPAPARCGAGIPPHRRDP